MRVHEDWKACGRDYVKSCATQVTSACNPRVKGTTRLGEFDEWMTRERKSVGAKGVGGYGRKMAKEVDVAGFLILKQKKKNHRFVHLRGNFASRKTFSCEREKWRVHMDIRRSQRQSHERIASLFTECFRNRMWHTFWENLRMQITNDSIVVLAHVMCHGGELHLRGT